MFQFITLLMKLGKGENVTIKVHSHRRVLNRLIWMVLAVVLVAAIAAGAPFDQ